jgi:hypothetical protein
MSGAEINAALCGLAKRLDVSPGVLLMSVMGAAAGLREVRRIDENAVVLGLVFGLYEIEGRQPTPAQLAELRCGARHICRNVSALHPDFEVVTGDVAA